MNVIPEIVSVLKDDGVLLVTLELVRQGVRVEPDQPERLLGAVHNLALGHLELPQHQGVLQRAVEVLERLHVVILTDLIAEVAQSPLLSVIVGLDLISQLDQLVQSLHLSLEVLEVRALASAVSLQDEAEPDKQIRTRDLRLEMPEEEMSNFPVKKCTT